MARRNKKSISMFLVSFLGVLVMMKAFTWVLSKNILIMEIKIPELDWAMAVVTILLMLRVGFVLWRVRRQRTVSLESLHEDPVGTVTVENHEECAKCGKAVSSKVKQYCLDRPEKFKGNVYCYEHQYR
ncbi:hypothetical protein [Paenibacillus solanacearum]|uniref:hypothetical protein n=1 Tax=Paenibacillus solanacearum TaxID=2048548 RepID=UPI001C403D05|nr:hypothetical protein [Paenibacillus solanacearum]